MLRLLAWLTLMAALLAGCAGRSEPPVVTAHPDSAKGRPASTQLRQDAPDVDTSRCGHPVSVEATLRLGRGPIKRLARRFKVNGERIEVADAPNGKLLRYVHPDQGRVRQVILAVRFNQDWYADEVTACRYLIASKKECGKTVEIQGKLRSLETSNDIEYGVGSPLATGAIPACSSFLRDAQGRTTLGVVAPITAYRIEELSLRDGFVVSIDGRVKTFR